MGKFEYYIKFFGNTIDCMREQSVEAFQSFLKEDNGLPILFITSRGSYSAAIFAKTLAVKNNRMAHALTPYMYLESGFKNIPAKVLLITASGNHKDAHRVVDHFLTSNSQKFSILLMSSKSSLLPRLEEAGADNIFVYSIANYQRDGFLATNTLLASYILLYKVYEKEDIAQ